MLPYTAAIASSAMMPSPPCSASSRFAGHGLTTSKRRNTRKPTIAPGSVDWDQGQSNQHPGDFVEDEGRRIDAPEVLLGDISAPHANREQQHNDGDLDAGRSLPADRCKYGEARGRPERAGRHWYVAKVSTGCDKQTETHEQETASGRSLRGQADGSSTTCVCATRSCSARRSGPMKSRNQPQPERCQRDGARQRAFDRRARIHDQVVIGDDADSRRHLADRLPPHRRERGRSTQASSG